jgi:dTDP-4-amino-4,6-dideoxygalactose transaminase
MRALAERIAGEVGRAQAVLCGRGTTALWLALRAIAQRDGPGELILPDLLCITALEGALLAGFRPVFADVQPGRFTLDPADVARKVTPDTRAILVAHLFGHTADMAAIRAAAPGVPIIEDAVQGLGGRIDGKPVGAWGDVTFVSFDPHKMIDGRGGAVIGDDVGLMDAITADAVRLPALPDFDLSVLDAMLPAPAARGMADMLRRDAPALLRPFDGARANVDRITAGWDTLADRVAARNTNAAWLADRLKELPLDLPDLRAGDAIWRYTISAPTPILARRIVYAMEAAGLSGSDLYPPLSALFGQATGASRFAGRLLNLFVDESATPDVLARTGDVIAGLRALQAHRDLTPGPSPIRVGEGRQARPDIP